MARLLVGVSEHRKSCKIGLETVETCFRLNMRGKQDRNLRRFKNFLLVARKQIYNQPSNKAALETTTEPFARYPAFTLQATLYTQMCEKVWTRELRRQFDA